MKKFSKAIHGLGEFRIQTYEEIMGLASEPELFQLRFPDVLEVPNSGASLDKHIYQDASAAFYAELNDWEKEVVSKELADPAVAYWIRNVPRKPWALAIPYMGDAGQPKGLYPDFIFLRKSGGGYSANLVDPHNPALGDSAAKLRGLAEYANLHGESFRRIEAVIMDGDNLIRINLMDPTLNAIALKVVTSNDVEEVFRDFGSSKRG